MKTIIDTAYRTIHTFEKERDEFITGLREDPVTTLERQRDFVKITGANEVSTWLIAAFANPNFVSTTDLINIATSMALLVNTDPRPIELAENNAWKRMATALKTHFDGRDEPLAQWANLVD